MSNYRTDKLNDKRGLRLIELPFIRQTAVKAVTL